MKNKNLIGLFLCTALFILGFSINGNISLYFNVSGLLIVFGGTFASTLISFRMEQLKIVAKVMRTAYTTEIKKETEIIEILIDLSIKSRIEGILSLQEKENETSILFLRRALGCLVDGFHSSQIRDILSTEMYFFKLRREDSERILRTIADFFPAFGIIGSVIGLVSMLGGIGDTSIILKAIPVALTSTLYGILFSNYFFLPFAANLRERTNHELLLQKIIMEGVIAIDSEMNSVILKTKLESFLTPSERVEKLVSYRKIKERFNIREETEEGPRVHD
ncbi:MAG: MotA/TolQ/ExbB proton channel family protein [Proteobacteria bacterium]|jgi:chemotaxis protein MotA|nr:flagellar motor protein MotA [Desulfocapsa sp.]MBU3943916.1 MotA/TolQ/ExbB proton channel family protein [Pseudomonadota bacterium]MCG2742924.1 MotA/TolQ/ExbB proton channel family protein [Desulfobacteraceae bacterium]MDO8946485.1 MotA/TolQ/ExbB proton channel family protein [Desulfocapsaceae bacterium]MBU3982324.1 MotA/TolQ/ExbB proton channel family protein [Pseudomonadota bacterium]